MGAKKKTDGPGTLVDLRHWECPECGWTKARTAKLEAQLSHIRGLRAQAEGGLLPLRVAARRMGLTVGELRLLLATGAVLDATVDGRPFVTAREVGRYLEKRAMRATGAA